MKYLNNPIVMILIIILAFMLIIVLLPILVLLAPFIVLYLISQNISDTKIQKHRDKLKSDYKTMEFKRFKTPESYLKYLSKKSRL